MLRSDNLLESHSSLSQVKDEPTRDTSRLLEAVQINYKISWRKKEQAALTCLCAFLLCVDRNAIAYRGLTWTLIWGSQRTGVSQDLWKIISDPTCWICKQHWSIPFSFTNGCHFKIWQSISIKVWANNMDHSLEKSRWVWRQNYFFIDQK